MPHRGRPRRGSLQFWPRKRAKSIYPRTNFWPESEEVKLLGFAGWKVGMTHVQMINNKAGHPTSGKIISVPVTIVDAPSLFVCGLRLYSGTHGSRNFSTVLGEKWASNTPKELKRKNASVSKNQEVFETKKTKWFSEVSKNELPKTDFNDVRLVVCTQPDKSGMAKKKPELFEIGIGGKDAKKKLEYAESVLGKELNASDAFKIGEYVDASGVTQGFGYEGPVKRYGIRVQTRKDKQMNRHVGSIGSTVPRKVDWRVPQAGQFGFFTRTEYSKRILMIDNDPKKITPSGGFVGYGSPKSYVLIEGSVPGTKKRLVRIRKATRAVGFVPVDIKYISVESKQGK